MSRRILIIDDEAAVSELVRILLTRAGYEVATASNGVEGLAQTERFHPELIITDITMPDMEGIELISKLKKRKEKIPIIAMSGNVVGRSFLKVTEMLGAAVTLTKPFSAQELFEAVSNALTELSAESPPAGGPAAPLS